MPLENVAKVDPIESPVVLKLWNDFELRFTPSKIISGHPLCH
jgi:hypothetical protein